MSVCVYVSVWPSPHSLNHCCADLDVTWGNSRQCSAPYSTQLNSTSNYGRRWLTPQCPHLSSQHYITDYNMLISWIDLSPILVRSAVTSYLTTWCIQNLSRRALNRHTVSTPWTRKKRGSLFLTITSANLNGFLEFLYHFNREEILHATGKIYHTTLIVCAPYFVNLNNTFQLKTLLFFVHLRS